MVTLSEGDKDEIKQLVTAATSTIETGEKKARELLSATSDKKSIFFLESMEDFFRKLRTSFAEILEFNEDRIIGQTADMENLITRRLLIESITDWPDFEKIVNDLNNIASSIRGCIKKAVRATQY